MVEDHFLLGPLYDLLLNAGLGDEPVHVHLLLLTDPVHSGLGLHIAQHNQSIIRRRFRIFIPGSRSVSKKGLLKNKDLLPDSHYNVCGSENFK